MNKAWVDFKAVKEAVSIEMVLDHYGITNLRKSGDELRGPCPIHKGSAKAKTFTVNSRKNAFKCFSNDCGARGNVLDLVAAIEGCSAKDAALKLKEWFRVGDSQTQSANREAHTKKPADVQRGMYRDEGGALYEVVIPNAISDDLEAVVVYRALFGDYAYYVATRENFVQVEDSAEPSFTFCEKH